MNLVSAGPAWLALLFLLLLAGAAVQDGWRLRISNLFPLAIIAGALIAAVIAGPRLTLWQNAALFCGLLAVGTFLFGARLVGGGDVKLFAAAGLWFDLGAGLRMILFVALAGGVLALLLLSARPLLRGEANGPRQGAGVPYGIAIAIGVAIVAASSRNLALS